MLQTALVKRGVKKGCYKIITAPARPEAKYTLALINTGDPLPGEEKQECVFYRVNHIFCLLRGGFFIYVRLLIT